MPPLSFEESSREQSAGLRPDVLFVLACTWTVVSLAGGRLAGAIAGDVARYGAAAVLLFGGFWLLARLGIHNLRPLSSLGLVRRPGLRTELGKGLALGWAVGLVMVLPTILSGQSQFRFDGAPGSWGRLLMGVFLLLLFAVFVQLLLAGLPMRLLVRVAGPAWALTAVLALTGLLAALSGQSSLSDCFFVMLSVSLFAVGFLRTRALWLSLGLQVGWTVSQCLLFGSPLPHTPLVSGTVFLNGAVRSPWLSGNVNGPELPAYALFVLLLTLMALVYLTREYAWLYTYQPPVPAGYPMDVKPPAQHEAQVAASPQVSLIQIAPMTTEQEPRGPHGL